jgi:NAD(P)-dependent dehydrogenase (short-subunit alcohol dehydrogenase family)
VKKFPAQRRTAIVTGGGHRLGRAISLGLARSGIDVVIGYLNSKSDALKTKRDAEALGSNALAIGTDVADEQQVNWLVEETVRHYGRVDVLINAASLFQETPLPAANTATWRRVTEILVNGAFFCSNAVAPVMLKSKGVIINVLDCYALIPRRHFAAHCVGKAALLAMTRQLAVDFAPKIRVNAVIPGSILKPNVKGPTKRAKKLDYPNLLGRRGQSEEVVDAILYLLNADYVTGACLSVDGGLLGHCGH